MFAQPTPRTQLVKVGEDVLTLENLREDENKTLIDQVDDTIQEMADALDRVDEGQAVVTIQITIKKDSPAAARDVSCKVSTALKTAAKKDERRVAHTKNGLVIERYEQQPLPNLSVADGGRTA